MTKVLYKPTDAEIFNAANSVRADRKAKGALKFTFDQVRAYFYRVNKVTIDNEHTAAVMREMFIDILHDDNTYDV